MAVDLTMSDPSMAVSIPLRPIYEEFVCPICMDAVEKCTMTPCGHNYCEKCIGECLNRRHLCPLCKAPCVVEDLRKNHHFDTVLRILNEMKERESKRHFADLIKKPDLSMAGGSSGAPASVVPGKEPEPGSLTPIEQVFHRHMTRSLAAYDEYHKQLQQKFEHTCTKVREDAAEEMTRATAEMERERRVVQADDALTEEQKEQRLRDVSDQCERQLGHLKDVTDAKILQLEESFRAATDTLLESYDQYMESFVATPGFLPCKVNVLLPSKDVVIEGIVLQTTDCCSNVRDIVMAELERRGNPLDSWGDVHFVLRKPFAERGAAGGGGGGAGGSGGGGTLEERDYRQEVPLVDEHRPIVQYRPDPGSEVLILGEGISLKSDRPKSCFSATFKPGDQVTYYTCLDCNSLNWVCETCRETCHRDHRTQLFLADHTPTFNCCYCNRGPAGKDGCRIPRKKTKRRH